MRLARKPMNPFKKVLVIVLILCSCNTSKKLYSTNQSFFESDIGRFSKNGFVDYVSNETFHEFSKFLTEKHNAQEIRLMLFIVTDSLYFCEFYTYRDEVKCLVLDENKNVFFEDSIGIDY